MSHIGPLLGARLDGDAAADDLVGRQRLSALAALLQVDCGLLLVCCAWFMIGRQRLGTLAALLQVDCVMVRVCCVPGVVDSPCVVHG